MKLTVLAVDRTTVLLNKWSANSSCM